MFAIHRRSARVLLSQITLAAFALAAPFAPNSFALPGDLYVTDLDTGSVNVYAPDGTASVFATGLTSPQGIVFDQGKNLYVADAGDGTAGAGTVFKYDLETKTPTVFRGSLNNPIGLTIDGSDLLVVENGADRVLRVPLDGIHPPSVFRIITSPMDITSEALNQMGFFRFISNGTAVTEVAPDGTATDVSFGGSTSRGVAVNASGDLFVSTDAGTVARIVANGGGINATFGSGMTQPTGMDFRPARFGGDTEKVGFLYVADTGAGEITQIEGTGAKSTFVSGIGSPNFIIFETDQPTPTPTPTPSPSPSPSPSPTPIPTPTPAGRPLNISTRADVETGDNVAIGGFIITGSTPKLVVLRGIGPSLTDADVPGALSDPTLELHDESGALLTTNDNWMENSAANQTILTDNDLQPMNDLESAIVMTLEPGRYTVVLSGFGGATGVGLVEAYDLDDPSAEGEFGNISTRGLVGTEANVLIGGIIIGPIGGDDASVVVRAIGPSLADLNPPVPNPLIDPVLELHNVDGIVVARNDNWETDSSPDNFSAEVSAAGLAPAADAESALFANLVPGSYTAIVTGQDGTVGVALVELYHVSTP